MSVTLGSPRHAIGVPDQQIESSSLIPLGAGISYQLTELLVLQMDRTRRHSRDHGAAVAIHEAPAQDEIVKPAPGSREPHRGLPFALAFREHLLRRQRGVGFDFFLVFVK